jgi:hypothetical protein
MPYEITEFETTPNPNALKCWLDRPISEGPRSFLNAEMAAEHPIAAALFAEAGVTSVLFGGDWLTVNKPAEAKWPAIKEKVRRVLARAEAGREVAGEVGRE